jgi:hypothetical protein
MDAGTALREVGEATEEGEPGECPLDDPADGSPGAKACQLFQAFRRPIQLPLLLLSTCKYRPPTNTVLPNLPNELSIVVTAICWPVVLLIHLAVAGCLTKT